MMNTNYINYLRGSKKSDKTIQSYSHYINEFLGFINKPDVEATSVDVMSYQGSIAYRKSASIALAVAAIHSYYHFLKLSKLIVDDPTDGIERPKIKNKEKPYMTIDDVRAMVAAANGSRDKAIVRLFASTGLRISELVGITMDDYETALANPNHELVILGKGDKEGRVYLSDAVIDAIEAYLNERVDGCDYLFTTLNGTKMDTCTLTRNIKRIAIRANLPYGANVSAHTLRAASATIMSENGVPVADISKALRHSSLAVTTRYIRTNQERINNAMATIQI